MIRSPIFRRPDRGALLPILLPALFCLTLSPAALAQQTTAKPGSKQPAASTTPSKSTASKTPAKPDAKTADTKSPAGKTAKGKEDKGKKVASLGDGKPNPLGSFGDWNAYTAAQGKERTCYALAMPKDRAPNALKRDQAYVFIASRPGENVRNEVSIIMGFAMKEAAEAKAEIGNTSYALLAKGTNAWLKNPAEETQFIDSMKRGSKLIVKAPSIKGNVTTDSYSLAGLSQALERVQKECQ
jgi:invasion protein IalB